jgi:dihydrofolate synthase/folylpolyglutamate synthase
LSTTSSALAESLESRILPWELPDPDTESTLPAYRLALDRLYRYSEIERSGAQRALGQDRKLDRMRTLLHALGTPQASFATVLVAGTKGKGSIAALLGSILHAAGYRVGRYTQPHLYSYRERTWARGQYVTVAEITQLVDIMEDAIALVQARSDELGPLTTFDVGTALTLLHFARVGVEIAVIEVGVGGANDATNALEPILSVIGPVGLDHVDVLGDTLAAIARQKAGVARKGIDVVVGRQEPQGLEAIRADLVQKGARQWSFGGSVGWIADDCCSGPFDVYGPSGPMSDLQIPLIGHFQRDNACLALAAGQLLDLRGWPISEAAIRSGLISVQWPGRFQRIMTQPLTIVDGAHNPTSARVLAATVRHYLAGRPVTLVLGMSDSKDLAGTLAELAPVARRLIATRASHSRACDPTRLVEAASSLAIEADCIPDPLEAVTAADREQSSDGVTLITGSLFLVGDVMEWLRREGARP